MRSPDNVVQPAGLDRDRRPRAGGVVCVIAASGTELLGERAQAQCRHPLQRARAVVREKRCGAICASHGEKASPSSWMGVEERRQVVHVAVHGHPHRVRFRSVRTEVALADATISNRPQIAVCRIRVQGVVLTGENSVRGDGPWVQLEVPQTHPFS
eukprot:3551842-Rhodomonas_salina.3